jgi:hypothetical protein
VPSLAPIRVLLSVAHHLSRPHPPPARTQDFARLADEVPTEAAEWAAKAAEAAARGAVSHYETLGVARDADAATVKKAFHAQCKRWHPDRASAASEDDQRRATTQFKRVNEAYQVRADQLSLNANKHFAAPTRLSQCPVFASWRVPPH